MAPQTTRGTCRFCGSEFAKVGMGRHLKACRKRVEFAGQGKPGRLLHLQVEGTYNPEYWMHLEVPAVVTLTELDRFLRWTWLECCGHLSAFEIDGTSYQSDLEPGIFVDDESMRGVRLGDVLAPGMTFSHEYDFGTTTHLRLRVIAERTAQAVETPVAVMARNAPPEIRCGVCGQPATLICAYCRWADDGWLCENCASTHACGDEAMLPVVNSPRVGMCGYTGESDFAPTWSVR